MTFTFGYTRSSQAGDSPPATVPRCDCHWNTRRIPRTPRETLPGSTGYSPGVAPTDRSRAPSSPSSRSDQGAAADGDDMRHEGWRPVAEQQRIGATAVGIIDFDALPKGTETTIISVAAFDGV